MCLKLGVSPEENLSERKLTSCDSEVTRAVEQTLEGRERVSR